jgi:hypothetical protein
VTDAFDDASSLGTPGATDADRAATLAALVRADLAGDTPGAVMRAFEAAPDAERASYGYTWNDAMGVDGLGDYIDADADRRQRAGQLAIGIAPPDPSPSENEPAIGEARAFSGWGDAPAAVLVVPGYTPPDLAAPSPDLHPIAQRRVDLAVQSFRAGKAPFILASGGAVYPKGTPYSEALLMKRAILAQGVPPERVLVDARARHSTTNLRNAGRIMRSLGMTRALVATLGGGLFGSDLFGQDFYFSNPTLSTFYARCDSDLGYRVGALDAQEDGLISFVPSADVTRVGFRDALDP